MDNFFLCKAKPYNGQKAKQNKHGLMPVVLVPVAGTSPSHRVLDGTSASNAGFEVGGTYLAQWSLGNVDPEYGQQFNFLMIQEVDSLLDIMSISQTLGSPKTLE